MAANTATQRVSPNLSNPNPKERNSYKLKGTQNDILYSMVAGEDQNKKATRNGHHRMTDQIWKDNGSLDYQLNNYVKYYPIIKEKGLLLNLEQQPKEEKPRNGFVQSTEKQMTNGIEKAISRTVQERIKETQNTKLTNSVSNGYLNGIHKGYSDSIPKTFEPLNRNKSSKPKHLLRPSLRTIFFTYFSFAVLIWFGYIKEFLRLIGLEKSRGAIERNRPGYVALFYNNFESFCQRNIYRRVWNVWNKPICSVPGAKVTVCERISSDHNWKLILSGRKFEAINMGSYNYMGFAENSGPSNVKVGETVQASSVSVGSTRNELGTLDIHLKLENAVAKYTGTEASIVVGMGFATNSTCIPAFVGKECLVLSDEFNHSSIILGCKISGATIKVFKHNDMEDLEKRLIEALRYGQTLKKTKGANSRVLAGSEDVNKPRPWKKVLIIAEGIYSMEGTIINLPEVIRLKKKYKAYLYLDEAHSIGSVGPRGRGVIDYYGCDPADVDILMGTFTKSFGAAGGFVAGSKHLIDHLRKTSHSTSYCTSMAAPIAQQVLCAFDVLCGKSQPGVGAAKIAQLARNVRYFRRKINQMGLIIYGSPDSPVVPLLIYVPAKTGAFLRIMEDLGVATVGAGFPATSLLESRARFCLSAAHDKELLDQVIATVDKVGDLLSIKYLKGQLTPAELNEDIVY